MSEGLMYMLDRAGATLAEMERTNVELSRQLAEARAQIQKLEEPSEVQSADG